MYCIRCGKENLDSAKFCNECGFDFREVKEAVCDEPKVKETPVAAAAPVQKEEPVEEKKKPGIIRRFLRILVICMVVYFVTNGGVQELLNSFDSVKKPDSTPAPTPLVLTDPDSRYPASIEGMADDEFIACIDLLDADRQNMKGPVFVRYESKALEMFAGAEFENKDLGRLAEAYVNLAKTQQGLYRFNDTSVDIKDEAINDQAQNEKYKMMLFFIDYFGALQNAPESRAHYEKMIVAYEQAQKVYEDIKPQLIGVDFLENSDGVLYLPFTNHTDHTYTINIDGRYEYPNAYESGAGYAYESWLINSIHPGDTNTIEFSTLKQDEECNVSLEWKLLRLTVDGEEVFEYYQEHK